MGRYEHDLSTLRKDIFLTAYRSGMAHLASAFSCVEIIYALYCRNAMCHDPARPDWSERDRFILSKGHGSLALYTVLCKSGYFGKDTLAGFCTPDTALGGEPSLCVPLGIEASTGSLGHGLSLGVGMALAFKADGTSQRVFVLLGDGECEEGSVWEAVMSAAKYGLDNLTVIIDNNHIQKMDTLENVMGINDWQQRFEAFGWACTRTDGHDVDSLVTALAAQTGGGRPHVLIADTVKGKGLSLMENDPAWHWRMPNRRELKVFMKELDITEEELAQCKEHI